MLEPPYETKTGLVLTKDGCGAWCQRMPAGWNVRVTTFDSEGNPRIVRNFLAYEADEERAVELVRKRVPVNVR
jgi:hypothetical protein